MSWREEPASLRQRAYLVDLGFRPPRRLSKGEASDLIREAKARQSYALHVRDLH